VKLSICPLLCALLVYCIGSGHGMQKQCGCSRFALVSYAFAFRRVCCLLCINFCCRWKEQERGDDRRGWQGYMLGYRLKSDSSSDCPPQKPRSILANYLCVTDKSLSTFTLPTIRLVAEVI